MHQHFTAKQRDQGLDPKAESTESLLPCPNPNAEALGVALAGDIERLGGGVIRTIGVVGPMGLNPLSPEPLALTLLLVVSTLAQLELPTPVLPVPVSMSYSDPISSAGSPFASASRVVSRPLAVPSRAPAFGMRSIGRARLGSPASAGMERIRLFDVSSLIHNTYQLGTNDQKLASKETKKKLKCAPNLCYKVIDSVPGKRGICDSAPPPACSVCWGDVCVCVEMVCHGD